MTEASWQASSVRSLGVYLNGSEIAEVDENGDRIYGDTLYVAFNAHHERTRFVLPRHRENEFWERLLDTGQLEWARRYRLRDNTIRVAGRSVAVFRLVRPGTEADGHDRPAAH